MVQDSIFVFEITRVEVLGYHKSTTEEDTYFRDIFNFIPIISPTQQIFDTALRVRKMYNLKLGDSIIAATASVSKMTIYTRNLNDFEKVSNVPCINPVT